MKGSDSGRCHRPATRHPAHPSALPIIGTLARGCRDRLVYSGMVRDTWDRHHRLRTANHHAYSHACYRSRDGRDLYTADYDINGERPRRGSALLRLRCCTRTDRKRSATTEPHLLAGGRRGDTTAILVQRRILQKRRDPFKGLVAVIFQNGRHLLFMRGEKGHRREPHRICRRLICLSHAAMFDNMPDAREDWIFGITRSGTVAVSRGTKTGFSPRQGCNRTVTGILTRL